MRKKFYFPAAVMAVVLLSGILSADTVVEEIVARVNSQIITRSEYQHEQQQLKDEAQQQDPTHADQIAADGAKDVLRGLIDRELLLDRGKEMDLNVETDVIKKLDELRKQMKLDSMEDLEKAATSQGVSFEDFKENMRTEIITQQVIQHEVGGRISVSKEDEQKFYDLHKSDMERPEAVDLSEILVSTDAAGDDPLKLSAAEAKANDLLKQIRAGASFEEIAKKQSQGLSAAQGGELGYFERGKLAKQLEDMTFAMKKGDVSDVIRTKQGYVILKVNDHQMPGVPSLKEVEPRVQEAVYMEKLQPALREYLTKLREDAYIKVFPGYVDSGASPNQTQPVETSAAKETNARALKKRKKVGVF